MFEWSVFYPPDEDDKAFVLQPFEYWVNKLETGPTQADRVLIHSHIMEQADERRFVIGQEGIDMSSFGYYHQCRVRAAIENFAARFASHHSGTIGEVSDSQEPYLIGLNSSATDLSRSEPCYSAIIVDVEGHKEALNRKRKLDVNELINHAEQHIDVISSPDSIPDYDEKCRIVRDRSHKIKLAGAHARETKVMRYRKNGKSPV